MNVRGLASLALLATARNISLQNHQPIQTGTGNGVQGSQHHGPQPEPAEITHATHVNAEDMAHLLADRYDTRGPGEPVLPEPAENVTQYGNRDISQQDLLICGSVAVALGIGCGCAVLRWLPGPVMDDVEWGRVLNGVAAAHQEPQAGAQAPAIELT